jgi:hypothetical protein
MTSKLKFIFKAQSLRNDSGLLRRQIHFFCAFLVQTLTVCFLHSQAFP